MRTTKRQQILALTRMYREETGEAALDPEKVAPWMHGKGVPLPKPQDPMKMLQADIISAERRPMVRALQKRREGIVDDAVGLELDADHWNGIHPSAEPIVLQMDFSLDIEWRKNSMPRRGRSA